MFHRLPVFLLATGLLLAACHPHPSALLVADTEGESVADSGTEAAANTTTARWIWYPEGDPRASSPVESRWFRRTFTLSRVPDSAWLWVAADNEYTVFLNGENLGEGKDFTEPGVYDLTGKLATGRNVLGVEARNSGGPAGLLAQVTMFDRGGETESVFSDGTWKAAKASPNGWTDPSFDDAEWVSAKVLDDPVCEPWGATEKRIGSLLSIDLHPPIFSPNGDGVRDETILRVTNRYAPAAPATLRIQDENEKTVARFPASREVETTATWDGTDRKERTVSDGLYGAVVEVDRGRTTLRLQKPLRVDTTLRYSKVPNRMKEVFPIGVWFDGRVEGINCPEGYHNVPAGQDKASAYYEENFTDIKAHGIDIVVIPNTPPEYRETLLSTADRVGVRIVLELVELATPEFGDRHSVRHPDMIQDEREMLAYCRALVAPLKAHPSLFCYQVLDEPPASLFDNFSLVSRALAEADPDHPSFSCLCFEQELPRTAALGTQMIVFDRYPLRKPSNPGDYDFRQFTPLLDNLDRHAGERPYWMVLQACAMDRDQGLRYPSPAEVRVMTWLSLAHNAKGVFYFLHNSYTQQEKLQGLVDLDLRPHPIYAEVADLNAVLRQLAPTLLAIQPAANRVTPAEGFDVGTFTDGQGKTFVFVVNLDVLESQVFSGRLSGVSATAALQVRNVLTGEAVPVHTQEGGWILTLRLRPGEGCLLALKAQ